MPQSKPPVRRVVRRSASEPKPAAAPIFTAKATANPIAQSIVAAIRKKVKGSKIDTLDRSSALADVTEWIPSGFAGLDQILGGGWAVGRASEVFGDEGCGKTAIAHRAILGVQSMGGYAVHLDFEAALDEKKILQLGIDPSRLIYEIPEHIEQGWDIIWATMDRLKESPPDVPVLIVWDSIGGAVPKAELEATSSDKHQVGEVARAMSKGCRKMFKAIAQVRAHMMWISQERHKIGGFSPFGPVKETSGGKGPKYAASQRVRLARVKTLKEGKRATGYIIKAITKKNRLAAPEQAMEWVIDFKVGPSPELTILSGLQEAGKVRAAGGKLVFPPWGKDKPFARSQWLDLIKDPKRRDVALASYLATMAPGARDLEEDDEVESPDG